MRCHTQHITILVSYSYMLFVRILCEILIRYQHRAWDDSELTDSKLETLDLLETAHRPRRSGIESPRRFSVRLARHLPTVETKSTVHNCI